MPIKGLTERRRFSRGGKLRIGEKKTASKNGREYEYPAKLDHFVLDPIDPTLLPIFQEVYGEKPRKLKIVLPSDDLETTFPQYYKCYGKSGLLCKGNGETAGMVTDDGLKEVECPGPEHCDFSMSKGVLGKPGCKQLASLQFFLPDLPVSQVFQFDTTSFNSIVNINSAIELMFQAMGRIRGIPVDFIVRPQEATHPENHKKIIIYVVDIVLPVGLRDLTKLTPLLGCEGIVPKPAETSAPEGLYASSQVNGKESVNTTTGEILGADKEPWEEDDEMEAEFANNTSPAPDLADDPDVVTAFAKAAFSPAKRDAMLASAQKGEWPKEQLLETIARHTQTKPVNGNGAKKPAAAGAHKPLF